MRIALVSDTFTPQVNGVTTVTARIVRALRERGHQSVVVAPAYPDDAGERQDELRIFSVPFPPYPAIRLSIPTGRRISRFLDAFGPDLVHVATEGPLGITGRRYALERSRTLVTSYHTDFPGYCRYYGAPILTGTVWRWLIRFHRAATLTQTPGEETRAELTRRGIAHAILWGRGVDTSRFHPDRHDARWRRRLGVPDDAVMVLHVGRLAPEKGLNVLIDAWRLAREALGSRAAFVIAGDGPLGASISARLPWVRRLGFLDAETLATLYASADLCVLPSVTETCGLVALEAMASGLPVIAAAAGGFVESIRNEVSGLLIAPPDARGFAAALIRMAMDKDGRELMGRAARVAAEMRDTRIEDGELIGQYHTAMQRRTVRMEASCAA